MGSGSSRPVPTNKGHVFEADTPVRFSPDIINSLQSSPESDNTRATDYESQIQSRVTQELQKLNSETDAALADLESRISPTHSATDNPSSRPAPGAPDQAFLFESSQTKDLSRDSVQKEINVLKEKLNRRQMREDVVGDKQVETAKEKMVSCLRLNDRKPLDCWQEVEAFKHEVARLEGSFLGRVLE